MSCDFTKRIFHIVLLRYEIN